MFCLFCLAAEAARNGGESAATAACYDLDRCIRVALANNPTLAAAAWEERAARDRWAQARAERFPVVTLTAGHTHWNDSQRLVPPAGPMVPGVYGRDIVDVGLTASWPLYTGGRIPNTIGASRYQRDAARHRLARSRRALVFAVSRTFYGILGQRAVIQSLEASREAIAEHRKRVRDLLDVQKAARVDLLRTEVRLANLDQALVFENNRLAILDRQMENLLGLSSPAFRVSITGTLKGPDPAPGPTVAESVQTALTRRADYLRDLAEIDAQELRTEAARAARLPTLTLSGSYGGRWAPNADFEQSGADDTEDVGWIGVRLSYPVFEGGRISARIREEAARLSAARERLNQLELDIRLEVQTAVLDIRSSLERVRATRKAIDQADESLRIERQKYEVGKGSITDVLDAQSALLEAQTNYYRALAAYHTARAEWDLAVGRDVP
ncbi:MAG: TolC family protein [Kiritimatiellaeota bacterium]|nr:TolC family protein [Kiritimatiellota bacterium]